MRNAVNITLNTENYNQTSDKNMFHIISVVLLIGRGGSGAGVWSLLFLKVLPGLDGCRSSKALVFCAALVVLCRQHHININ